MPPSAAESTPQVTQSVAQLLIAATFTAAPISEPLEFWISEFGLPYEVSFTPYQQLFQTLLDPAGPFSKNERGVNVALFRLEDLGPEGDLDSIERHTRELTAALHSSAAASRAPIVACLCPPSSRFLETGDRQRFHERLEREFAENMAGQPNVRLLSASEIIADYRVTAVEDAIAERSGHVPYHSSFFAGLATAILRIAVASTRSPVKVIAFDCDNTLWTGVCGEDGPQNVQIDEGRRALQKLLLEQRRAGVLLAVASKNNEADVRETFSSHAGMLLQWSDIVVHRINWESKSRNLLEIARELNLGLDTFVFLDDDAKECAEVRAELPEITTLQLPHESNAIPAFFSHAWIFDRAGATTAEDAARSTMYAEQLERSRFEKQARDLREFLGCLRLDILFAPITTDSLPRAVQLTQRTNQMNSSLVRYTESELKAGLDSGLEAFTVTVSDRFGSYGLVGLVLFRTIEDAVRIESVLLSCRALGRGVEHRMIQHAAEIAESRGKDRLEIAFTQGPRNQPALVFLGTVTSSRSLTAFGEYFAARIADALKIEFLPEAKPDTAAAPPKPVPAPKEAVSRLDYQRIANSLSSAEAIETAMLERRRLAHSRHQTGTPPQTELQLRLAGIWSDLLGLPVVGIDEDFFDLGGHSLLAVQLLSRIHHELQIELPDSVIYGERLRIDSLARAIELQQLGVRDQAAYDAMLEEIESLSDEEVAALLAKEESPF